MAEKIVEYEIASVRRAWYDRACRYALQSITRDNNAVEPEDGNRGDTQVRRATHDLIYQWRARINGLKRKGWDKVQEAGWYYATNCPPVAVSTGQRLRPCRLQQVCPFCWCRKYVLEACNRVHWFYYGTASSRETAVDPYTKEELRPEPRPCDLVEVRTTFTYAREEKTVVSLFEDIAGIDPVDGRMYGRDQILKDMNAVGALQLFTVEPPDPRDAAPVWRWSQRILAIMPIAGGKEPNREPVMPAGALSARRDVSRLTDITRTNLAAVIGRVTQYPPQMLRGSAEDTVSLLRFINGYRTAKAVQQNKVSRGFRMASYYGVLRNKTQQLLEAKISHR